jgi:hypothetical protein
MRSDIFDNFVKIAIKDKLIESPKDQDNKYTEKSFHDTNPRMDSLSIEQIAKLYNNKPETYKDMQYKRNIMEIAHPESQVISPSYDKLNGLVENENEGQDIRINISLKKPDGLLINKKYAEGQFIRSLVALANDLDNNNQVALTKLADTCLNQITKKSKIVKIALYPQLFGALATAIGVLWAKQHLRFHSDGFEQDYQKVTKEINDLLSSNSNWGVGYSYTPQFIKIVNTLQAKLETLYSAVSQVFPLIAQIQDPKDRNDLMAIAKQQATQDAAKAIENLKTVLTNINPYINTVISNFQNPLFKQRAIQNKGVITSVIDSADILHGDNALFADDLDDVSHALQTLKVDINNIIKELQKAEHMQDTAKAQMNQSDAEVNTEFTTETPKEEHTETPSPSTPDATTKPITPDAATKPTDWTDELADNWPDELASIMAE